MGAAAGIGAVASGIGSIANASGSRKAAKAQDAASQRQAELEAQNLEYQKERDVYNDALTRDYNAQEEAQRQEIMNMVKEGYSDPTTGMTVRYVPGKGYVSTYSPEAGQRIQAENRENLMALTEDAQRARRGKEQNELRRNDEGSAADAQLAELEGQDPYDTKRIIADLVGARTAGINDAYDQQTSQMLTSNLRTGTASDNLLAQVARERAKSLGDARKGAYTEGLSTAEDLRGARTSRLGNLYNTLASRASNVEDAAFAPNNLSATAASAAQSKNPGTASGVTSPLNPRLGAAPQFDTSVIQPKTAGAYGMYSLASLANSTSAIADKYDSRTKKSQGGF